MNPLFWTAWGFVFGFLCGWTVIYLISKKRKE